MELQKTVDGLIKSISKKYDDDKVVCPACTDVNLRIYTLQCNISNHTIIINRNMNYIVKDSGLWMAIVARSAKGRTKMG